jgi:uncharacterized protein YbjQ (UPF0145 family)
MGIYGSGKKTIWRIGILFVLSVPLFITACARTRGEVVKLSTDIYPPKSVTQEILITQGDIEKPYREIAIVKAEGNRYTKEEECLEKVRRIAREVGADAVIKAHVEKTERLVSREIPTGKFRRTVTYKVNEPVCEGTAVVFTNNG